MKGYDPDGVAQTKADYSKNARPAASGSIRAISAKCLCTFMIRILRSAKVRSRRAKGRCSRIKAYPQGQQKAATGVETVTAFRLRLTRGSLRWWRMRVNNW
jgi:hypothetical protein